MQQKGSDAHAGHPVHGRGRALDPVNQDGVGYLSLGVATGDKEYVQWRMVVERVVGQHPHAPLASDRIRALREEQHRVAVVPHSG